MNTKSFLKFILNFSVILIITESAGQTGCSKDSNTKAPAAQTQQAEKKDAGDLSIVRDKNVDVDSLDQNKNGYLYQCAMDYDVISDKPGTCPKCGMELKEVTLAQAKKNLIDYGFQVK
jgi:hypothetical protein